MGTGTCTVTEIDVRFGRFTRAYTTEYELITEATTLNFLSSETALDPLFVYVWGRGNSWRAGRGQQ
jgi:hypothetical protein